jgi:Holliday junction resolvase
MRESTIERDVCTYAKQRGCLVIKQAAPGHRGVPDRLFLFRGEVLFIEFKQPGKKPTALQDKWLRDLAKHEFRAIWCDDAVTGKRAIDQLVER